MWLLASFEILKSTRHVQPWWSSASFSLNTSVTLDGRPTGPLENDSASEIDDLTLHPAPSVQTRCQISWPLLEKNEHKTLPACQTFQDPKEYDLTHHTQHCSITSQASWTHPFWVASTTTCCSGGRTWRQGLFSTGHASTRRSDGIS